jgi:hypothetical protein
MTVHTLPDYFFGEEQPIPLPAALNHGIFFLGFWTINCSDTFIDISSDSKHSLDFT